MKNQKGFTLIELLLVLAIIGIISAIAIPALLGQRARARDKSASANCATIIPDLVSAFDKMRDTAAAPANLTALVGVSGNTTVPTYWTGKNPWDATATAYAAGTAPTATDGGAATAAGATITNKGQVMVGYLAPAAGANGAVAAAVMLNAPATSGVAFIQSAGLD